MSCSSGSTSSRAFSVARRRRALRSALALLALAAFVLPSGARAQAGFKGTVREDSSKTPLANIEVVIQALNARATTDSAGRFLIPDAPKGYHQVLFRSIGFRPVAARIYLVDADTLEVAVDMRRATVELPPIEVTASAVPVGMQDFEDRRVMGFGRFIDWTVLRKSEDRRLSDLLDQIPGVSIRYTRSGNPIALGRKNCPMTVYLNGVRAVSNDLSTWGIHRLEAVEVYRGAAETPAEFGNNSCGTLVLWWRRR